MKSSDVKTVSCHKDMGHP